MNGERSGKYWFQKSTNSRPNGDTLSESEKGDRIGYILGRNGSDIFMLKTTAKIASKSKKGLASVLKNVRKAEKIVMLEAVSGVGKPAQVGEAVSKAKKCKSAGTILDRAVHTGRHKPSVPLEKSKVDT